MYKKRKGFTLIELVVSMCIIAILMGCVFIIPKLVYDTRNTVNAYGEYTDTLKLLHVALQKDLSRDLNSIVEQNNEVVINNVVYKFTEEGVFRERGGKSQKLTDVVVYYEIGEGVFRIYTDEDINNNKIDLEFNLEYTTIPKGRI